MSMDGRYLKNAGAIFNGMSMDGRYLKNAGAIFNGMSMDGGNASKCKSRVTDIIKNIVTRSNESQVGVSHESLHRFLVCIA